MVDFNYKKQGSGRNNLIFFHGFGEDHSVFDKMVAQIIQKVPYTTCYTIDIYYHGKSDRENQPLKKQDWQQLFGDFLIKEEISSFHLVGFSLGGRFAIASAIQFTRETKSIFLIAPDGIYQSLWYRFANTVLGNRLFKYLIHHPLQFDKLITFFGKAGLVPKPLIKFVDKTLNTEAQRNRVYQTWTYFHSLQHTPTKIRSHINQYVLKTYLLLGTEDSIIPPDKIIPHLHGIASMQIILLPAKHHKMIEQSIPHMISLLKRDLL